MKEVFRAHDFAKVSYYRDLLEGEGIATMLRNEDLVHGVIEVPIPEFFPNLCVMDDGDYQKAWELIDADLKLAARNPGPDVVCPSCGERNPGNFAECFSCQTSLPETKLC